MYPHRSKTAKAFVVIGALFYLFCSFAHSQTSDESGRQLMLQGQNLLQQSKDLEVASLANLKRSNEIRQSLLLARRQSSDNQNNNPSALRSLSQELATLQQQGSLLRAQSKLRQSQALDSFSKGMQQLWPDWIKTVEAFNSLLIAENKELPIQAHNVQLRSVHPGLQDETIIENSPASNSMTLQPSTSLPAATAEDIDRDTFRLSRDHHFIAHIEAANLQESSGHTIPINSLHRWTLIICDLHGQPISNASIKFLGHMPGHVHGLPTQPQIDKELEPGVYQVSGVKFQMQGWWVIDFEVEAHNINDVIRFNVVL